MTKIKLQQMRSHFSFYMSIKKEISLATDIIFCTGNDQSCIILKAYAYFAVKFTNG